MKDSSRHRPNSKVRLSNIPPELTARDLAEAGMDLDGIVDPYCRSNTILVFGIGKMLV